MNSEADASGPSPDAPSLPAEHGRERLQELAWLFLRLGTTAFGGPAAHIAMMEDEVVARRDWISRERFLDLLGATNMIPGPNSTEMAIHLGYLRGGWLGLVVAGCCFILPATLIVAAIAWAYVAYGSLPAVAGMLYGVKPVVIAVVLQALWRLAQTALKTKWLLLIAVLAAAAGLLEQNELATLFLLAAVVAVFGRRRRESTGAAAAFAGLPVGAWPLATASVSVGAAAVASVSLGELFYVFLKIGSVLFGSGYVLLAFLRADLVERLHWLSESQLLDATAVGQITPGPVFTTATFIGYVLAGPRGALLATLGIFLPAFVFVAASAPLVHRLRRSALAGRFLDGLNAASLGLMAAVTWQLGRSALIDVPTLILAAASAVALLRYRVNSTWLVAAGATIGAAVSLLGR